MSEAQTKLAVSVAEMARMVGLSRARFYQLVGEGIFPPPSYALATRRPLYLEDAQKAILDARRRNAGFNGQPILFRLQRRTAPVRAKAASTAKRRPGAVQTAESGRYAELADALKSLGLATANAASVGAAMAASYPNGDGNATEGEVVRTLYLSMRRQQPGT